MYSPHECERSHSYFRLKFFESKMRTFPREVESSPFVFIYYKMRTFS